MTTSKVRIYDLARELKADTKRLIEDLRREGVDVSVPSNSVSREMADKIRDKYLPPKEVTSTRTVRVVKKAARAETSETEENIAPAQEVGPEQKIGRAPKIEKEALLVEPVLETKEAEALQKPIDEESRDDTQANSSKARPLVTRIIKKIPAATEHSAVETESSVGPLASHVDAKPSAPLPELPPESIPTTTRPSRAQDHTPTQIRVLRPTTAALNAGIRPGEKIPTAPLPMVDLPHGTPEERRRSNRMKDGVDAAPEVDTGKRKTPQIVYTPSTDHRKPGGRNQRTRRGSVKGAAKHKHTEQEFVPPPRPVPIEERIARDLNFEGGTLKSVRLIEGVTVKEFAEKLGIKPKDIVALLLKRGVLATLNQPLNDEVVTELGRKFGFDVSFASFEVMTADEEIEELIAADADDIELPRAPVVTVMGHVDHGKTSLLDAIRATNVAEGEAGGITQHIGAYSVQVPNPDDPKQTRRVVFLDTPGHEAFTMMRARGAKATDVVILVVAADDGVMPQTIEAIEHARAANVSVVVAINKIDKPDANPDRVKQELASHGLQPIEWGGDTEVVPISARKGENIDLLLETVLLTSDLLNLRASQTRRVSGVVLEAKLDRGRGAVATVLVQQGTLRVGDPFIVGQVFGKVRAMLNDRGEIAQEAGPASPVEVLGMQGVPQAGDSFQVVADITRAQQISHQRQMASRQSALEQTTRRGIEALGHKEVKELLVILKADVQGSVEVLKSTLQKLSTDRVKVKVIRSGVGALTESDVLLASATQLSVSSTAVVIIGFNVRPGARTAELAKLEGVDIRLHSIIYKVEEEIRAAMLGMLEAIEKEKTLGKAEVREVFRVPKLGAVAGSIVLDGVIRRNVRARLIRDGIVTWEGDIASLRRFKEDAAEVREGFECGIGLVGFNDIKVGDQIEAYVIEKVAATEL